MAPEVRTIIRYMDDYIGSGDYQNAISRGIQALQIYDEEREFENSMTILDKLIHVAETQRDTISLMKYVDNLKVRALLSRNKSKYQEICKIYSNVPETPLSTFLTSSTTASKSIIVEALELQTIFGDFEPVVNVPYIAFSNSDDALQIIKDYFEPGRYLINLLNKDTALHQSLHLDIGDPEEYNIVDRSHTFKIT